MDEWIPTLRMLMAAGLALLLIMLRLEAAHFSAAEYDDAVDGRAPSFRRRIAWYAIGLALVAAIYIVHPSPQSDFALGPGDRQKTIFFGLLYGDDRHGDRDGRRPLPLSPAPLPGRLVLSGRAPQRGRHRDHRRGRVPRRRPRRCS